MSDASRWIGSDASLGFVVARWRVFSHLLCVFVSVSLCLKALRAQRHRDNGNSADFGNWLFSRFPAGPVDLAVSSELSLSCLTRSRFREAKLSPIFWRRDWLGGWRLWGKGSRGLLPFLSRDLPMPILLIQVTFSFVLAWIFFDSAPRVGGMCICVVVVTHVFVLWSHACLSLSCLCSCRIAFRPRRPILSHRNRGDSIASRGDSN